MQTLKTAAVVVLLLMVMYGAYVALNVPEPLRPEEIERLTEVETDLDIDMGGELPSLDEIPPPASAAAAGSLAMAGSDPSHGAAARLPDPDPAADGATPDPDRDYPRTGAAGAGVPDPHAAAAAVAPPADFQMLEPDAPSQSARDDRSADDATDRSGDGADASASLSDEEDDREPAAAVAHQGFTNALQKADEQVAEGRLREALFTLSVFYGSPDLDAEADEALLERLDPLAGEVIYSPRHLIERPHRVGRGETLRAVAEQYQVPWQLLANVNGIDDADALLPGTELKVVNGPFRAEVSLDRGEITLFLGDLYAGRFPFVAGDSPAPVEGAYEVKDKRTDRAFYGNGGQMIPADDPRNPYGQIWLDLGSELCMHGSPEREADGGPTGCIRLSPVDARDLYGILAEGSPVTVRR